MPDHSLGHSSGLCIEACLLGPPILLSISVDIKLNLVSGQKPVVYLSAKELLHVHHFRWVRCSNFFPN